ncbi:LysE family translocator [Pseudahrensia aquimaris]|uniref:LysE family translocator n=1 Tax=Pseudahrensia aquimaris TaxID=744461 RepID=A0ABW3FP45_9HYPH
MLGIEWPILIAYTLGCIALVAVPGPTVTVIIANSLRSGARAGLLNVAGTQAGLLIMLAVVAFGLDYITTSLAFLFDWLRLIGAAYLVWLGWKLLRSDGSLTQGERKKPNGSFFWQGFLVIWSNPKALLLFGAGIPQVLSLEGSAIAQTLLLGGIFMVVATIIDSLYAFAAGSAGNALTKRNIRTTEVLGGTFMMGGGLWLGLTRNS